MKTIRNAGAKWLTGVSTSEASKATLMTSLFLETVMDLPGEVFVTAKFSPRLLQEVARRKRVVIMVTDDPNSRPVVDSAVAPLGVLTTRPTLFQSAAAK
jgi:hypothetical protein